MVGEAPERGFPIVDYRQLGFAPQDVEAMRQAGARAMLLALAAA